MPHSLWQVAVGGWDGRCREWHKLSGEFVHSAKYHSRGFERGVINIMSSSHILAKEYPSSVKIWDEAEERVLASFLTGEAGLGRTFLIYLTPVSQVLAQVHH